MRNRRERTLEELYDATEKLSEPKISPVMKGEYRMQGPVDEHVYIENMNSQDIPGNSRCSSLVENPRSTAEPGTCNVCSAPCFSCLHLNNSALMEPEYDCGSSLKTSRKKEDDSSSYVDVSGHIFKNREYSEQKHACREGGNLLTSSPSCDSSLANAESRVMVTASVFCDTSENVEVTQKAPSDGVEGGTHFPEETSLTSASPSPLFSCKISDIHNRETSNLAKENHELECLDYNISYIPALEDPKIASHACHVVGRSTTLDGLLSHVEEKTTQDATDGNSDNNARQAESCRVELKRKRSTTPTTSLVKDNLADDFDNDLNLILRSRLSLKEQSPFSLSENAFSSHHSYDSRNEDGVKSIQSSTQPAACTVDRKNVAQGPNGKASNANQTLVFKKESDACLGNELDTDVKFVSCGTMKPSNFSLQPIKSSSMIQTSNVEVSELNQVENSESEGSDETEYDVNVCDICGDAGQEAFLAFCSRCDDGAEHTYCMRKKMHVVPEGDWLCEECHMKEDTQNRTSGKFETEQMTGKSLNLKSPKLGRKPDFKCLPSRETKAMEIYVRRSIKEPSSAEVLTKRILKNPGTTLPSDRQKAETLNVSPRTNLVAKATSLLRESSFSKPDLAKSKISLEPNSSKMQSRTESMKGPSLLKSLSFNSIKVAKVKQLTDAFPLKRKASGESSYITRDEGPPRKFTKSLSLKNASSCYFNGESKADFLSLPHSSDLSGAKVVKERRTLDKKSSSLSDHPSVPPRLSAPSISDVKLDKKAEQYDKKLNKTPEWANTYVRKRLNDGNSSGSVERKKHVPQSRSSSSQILLKSEDQKHSLLSPKAADATHRDNKCKEFASVSSPGAAVSGGCRISRCHRCNEPGHSSHVCPVDRHRVSATKPSSERNSKDERNRGNMWKDSVEVAIPKLGIKFKDQSGKFPTSETHLNFDMTSKDNSLPLISAKALPSCHSPEVPFDAQKMVNRSSDNKISTVLHGNQKLAWQKRYQNIPKKKDVNDARITTDVSRKKIDSHVLHTNNFISSLVIPHPEYIWQGAFEVVRSGNAPVIYDGFQAHFPTCVSPKAVEVAADFPCRIKLEEVPRKSSWPMQFLESGPKGDNIALFFFAKDNESHKKYYLNQVDHMIKNDLALRGSFDMVELLIFPSISLPEDSQRWNSFFFLWGVFKGNKRSCSKKLPVCEQKLPMANFRNKPIIQDLCEAAAAGVSFHHELNTSSEKDISMGDISPEAKTINHATRMELQDVSGTETNIHETGDVQKNDHKELTKKNLVPSSTSCLASIMGQLQGPSTIPERKIHTDIEQFYPDEDSDVACLNGLVKDSHSRGHAVALHDDCIRSNCTDTISYFSGYTSKPIGEVPSDDIRNVDLNDKIPEEKMELDDGGHAPYNLIERTSACKLSSKIHPLTCGFMEDEFKNAKVYDISKSAEKCLFSLDEFSGTRAKSEDHEQTFSSDDKHLSDPDDVDLELALGDKKNVDRQEVLPLFSPEVSQKSKSKLPISSDVGADEPAILSLSLAFPDSQKAWETETIAESDQLFPGNAYINTSLNLFKNLYELD